ncbi:hypothetical protein TCDM_11970 [Trypanosoma cruzi Dm28c]|uniref:Uncharacterized protein n=1 Tax=Trypanosoma cruzi Dm28c TaxID=1416333 RepID=V5CZ43_TRYCR|nr:hypothetical protein TCDM_11970 [Trypanosoma cruzi Dm28c]
MTDRQAEKEMNGCRQEALTINMASEHAATPRRNTGEKGEREKKQEAAQHTRKKQTTGGESTANALTLTGNSTPALTHTNTHHHGAVSPRVRGFVPPHNKRTYLQQSHTMHEEKRHTASIASSSIPRPTGYGHSPLPTISHTKQEITQRATRRSDSSPSHDAVPHSMWSRGAHRFLNTNYSAIHLRCFC